MVSLTFTDGILTDCRQIVLACRQYFKPEPAELDELIRRLQDDPSYPPAQLSLFRSDYRRAQQALGKTVRLMLRPAAQDNRPAAGAAAAIKRCDRRTALAAAVTAAGANPLAAQLAERLLDSQDPDAVIKAFVDDRLAGQPAVEPSSQPAGQPPIESDETQEDLF